MIASLLVLLLSTPLHFEEQIVAGSPADFMIVRRLELSGSNEQIGEKLAEIADKRHGVKLGKGNQADISRQRAWLERAWPEMAARVRGVAMYFNAKADTDDPTQLNYDLDVPGCSVVFYPGSSVSGGHSLLSRNYDFSTQSFAELVGAPKPKDARAMTGDPYVIEMHPDKGYASLYIASYDLLGGCIDGVNEKGLAVALLADDNSRTDMPKFAPGLTEIRLTRFVLDRCATATEARKELASVAYRYTFIPCHYMIADASGDSFVWEISADLSKRYVVNGKSSPQIVTNHLLSKYGNENLPAGNSFDRFRRLQSEIATRKGRISPDEASTINACVAVPSTARNAATLWHALYDLTARTVKVSFYLGRNPDGSVRRTGYLPFTLSKN